MIGELSGDELRAVLVTAREQMLDAVAAGSRKHFSVYRQRDPCPVCGTPIASRGQGDGTGRPTGAPAARVSRLRRHPSYYVVAGVALDREMERLRALPVFSGGALAEGAPELKVRRARRKPNRLGFAVPTQFRLSVTAYPDVRPGDVLETLLHELAHLHVGRAPEAHAWHGPTFKATLAQAMSEAYGINGNRPSHSRHGIYAEEIERARSHRIAEPRPA